MPSLRILVIFLLAWTIEVFANGSRKAPNWYYNFAKRDRATIEAFGHRGLVDRLERFESGGLEQLEFLKERGLLPHHKFLELGCGVLRLGRHLVEYLDKYNYYGIDINRNFLDIGRQVELKDWKHRQRLPKGNLIATATYDASRFDIEQKKFDFIFAYGLWTLLPKEEIAKCMVEISRAIDRNGLAFLSYYRADEGSESGPVRQNDFQGRYKSDYGEFSFPDKEPYHHTESSLRRIAEANNLKLDDFGHFGPDNHRIVRLRPYSSKAPDEL